MSKKARIYWSTSIPMGVTLKNQSFDLIKEITSAVTRSINEARESWLFGLLNSYGIKVDRNMSKRELIEKLEKHKVVIKKLDKHNLDRVYIGDKDIGTWSNNYKYHFNSEGKLTVTIKHTSPTKNLP